MTITTAKGKEFNADLAVESTNPERLYVHIINTSVAVIAAVFTNSDELPVQGYPAYTAFDSMSITPSGGVNICLKKGA